ncbi:MAG TPA: mercuric transporter MerT family protein [Woeseiaceae bacterium]|nr:mercuric transporter MerT family protein [Woeseiaceae bacterium]
MKWIGLVTRLLPYATCCIVPLVLITLGASGAWIGSLTALKDY